MQLWTGGKSLTIALRVGKIVICGGASNLILDWSHSNFPTAHEDLREQTFMRTRLMVNLDFCENTWIISGMTFGPGAYAEGLANNNVTDLFTPDLIGEILLILVVFAHIFRTKGSQDIDML